jgi:hypothetical protein
MDKAAEVHIIVGFLYPGFYFHKCFSAFWPCYQSNLKCYEQRLRGVCLLH